MAKEGDEGRGKLRKASGSRKQAVIWGSPNPLIGSRIISGYPLLSKVGSEKRTRGSEPSQYPEEEKANSDSRSSGERNGKSLNHLHVQACERCAGGVAGCHRTGLQPCRRVTNPDHSRTVLERLAIDGDSPVSEMSLDSLGGTPKYHGTRGTLWESGRTISQG